MFKKTFKGLNLNLKKTLFYLTILNQNNDKNQDLKIFLNPTNRPPYFSGISNKIHNFCSNNPTLHKDFLSYILKFLEDKLIYINEDNTVYLSKDGLKFLRKHKITSLNKLDEYLLINDNVKGYLKNDEYYNKAMKLLYIINNKKQHRYTTIEYLKNNTEYSLVELKKFLTYLTLNNYLDLKVVTNYNLIEKLSFNGQLNHRHNLIKRYFYYNLRDNSNYSVKEELYFKVSNYLV